MNETIVTAFGAIGLILLIAAFYLEHFKQYSKEMIEYNALNFLGGLILTIYAFITNAFVFVFLEGIWTIAALYFIVKGVRK